MDRFLERYAVQCFVGAAGVLIAIYIATFVSGVGARVAEALSVVR